MTPRPRRRGERGSAMVVVAFGAVSLLAVTGLAIDGGMAASTYRHAQNAADAGALAAVRQEFVDAESSPPVASTASSLTSVAQKEVLHNAAQVGDVSSASIGSSSGTTTLWGPSTTGGMSAQASFAELSTTLAAAPPLTPAIDLDATAAKAYGYVKTAATTPPYAGSSASAQAELVHGSSQELGQSGDAGCQSSSAAYTSGQNTVGAQGSCTTGSVPTQVTYGGTVVASANADSQVSSANGPSSNPDITVLGMTESLSGTGPSASASTVQSSDNVGWDPLLGVMSRASVTATNVAVVTPKLNVNAATVSMSLTVSMGTASSHPTITPLCTPVTLTLTSKPSMTTYSVPIGSNCQAGALPNIGDMTLTGAWYSPGSDYTTACTSSGGGWSCSMQACMLRMSDPDTSTTICLGQAVLSFGIVPITTVVSASAGAVSVTASIAQPTYFMRVLGWSQTNPTATAVAAAESVVDEPPSSFTASPYGMPVDALEMDSPFIYGALQVGHEYYLYGGNMGAYNPVAGAPTGWQGQLDSTRGHRVGSQVALTAAVTPAPQFYSGTSYYLEPVYDPASLTVLYYAEFLPVSNHPNWGKLVNSIPASGGAIVSADGAGLAWTVLTPGAVTLKVVQ